MIDPRELRIGNYVSANINDIVRNIEIHAITTCGVSEYGGLKEPENPQSTYERKWISVDAINPIPLTEDILLKCGFKPYKSHFAGHWYENFYFELANLRPDDDLWVVRIFKHHMPGSYKYLHQIQNLWRDVTGEELEVKL